MGYMCGREFCSKQIGGLRAVHLLKSRDLISLEYDRRSNSYHSLNVVSGSILSFYFRDGEAVFSQKLTTDRASKKITQTLKITLSRAKEAVELLEQITTQSDGFVAFVEDMQRKVWVVGYNHLTQKSSPMQFEDIEVTTNLLPADAPQQSLVLRAMAPCGAAILTDDIEYVGIR